MDDKVTLQPVDAVGLVTGKLAELDEAVAVAYRLACELGMDGIHAVRAVGIRPVFVARALSLQGEAVQSLASVLVALDLLHDTLHNDLERLQLPEPVEPRSGGGKPPRP